MYYVPAAYDFLARLELFSSAVVVWSLSAAESLGAALAKSTSFMFP